jgi:hypothetical protein
MNEKCQRVGCLSVPFHGHGYCSNTCEQIDTLETKVKRLREEADTWRQRAASLVRYVPGDVICGDLQTVADAYREREAEVKRLRGALGEMRDVAAAMARVIVAKNCVTLMGRELREAGIRDGFGARADAALRGEEAR